LFKNNVNRSIPTKPPHPNQYTVNRSNNNTQISQQQSSKNSLSTSQATRQSNNNINNSTLPAAATRISSTVPTTATKNSSVTSTTSNSSKSIFIKKIQFKNKSVRQTFGNIFLDSLLISMSKRGMTMLIFCL